MFERLFVVEQSMAEHFYGLTPYECDVCLKLGIKGLCDTEVCAGRIRDQLETQIFGFYRRSDPGIRSVYFVNEETISSEEQLPKNIIEE
jgi:hypothetical protein